MKLKKLENKRILILGFGREGRDNFLFLRKLFPDKILGIADAKYKIQDTKYKIQDVTWHLGKDYLSALKDYDIIIKSPGIPFRILPKSQLKKIITQTDIFFDNCPGKIIGVTGTKGKSTTSSLIYRIFKMAGKNVHLIGNIEKPVLSFLAKAKPNDIFVYELSSHQLYNLKRAPAVAVFLNIYPEHLDYYKNFQEYGKAKANIALRQKKDDYLVFNAGDKIVSRIAKKSKAKKIPIQGKYYDLDKNAAAAVARILKIPEKIISRAVKTFKPLENRLEFIGTFKGIDFYNDALATIPEATIAAIEYLGDRVETIMLGGFDRKINFKNLGKKIAKSKIKTAILFPTTGKKIWLEVKKNRGAGKKLPERFFADDMESAVKLAYRRTSPGKICLLSTASSSFSIFRDYKEKGDLFKKFVKKFGYYAPRKRNS